MNGQEEAKVEDGIFINCSDWRPCPEGILTAISILRFLIIFCVFISPCHRDFITLFRDVSVISLMVISNYMASWFGNLVSHEVNQLVS